MAEEKDRLNVLTASANETGLPFRLSCAYIMWEDAVTEEFTSPSGLGKRLQIVTVLDTTAADVYNSMLSDCPDFEDGVMAATALREGVGAIITRDAKGFARFAVPAYAPEEFLALLEND